MYGKILENYRLNDVLAEKISRHCPQLVDVSADASISDTLALLRKHQLIAIPVYGVRGRWLSAGGESRDASTKDKQYIGIVSILDIVVYLTDIPNSQTARFNLYDRQQSLETIRVLDVVGESEEGKSLWTGKLFHPLFEAIEPMAKGIHRVLVPVYDLKTFDETIDVADRFQIITQTDIVRFIIDHLEEDSNLNDLLSQSVEQLGFVSDKRVVVVEREDRLLPVFKAMVDNELSAVAIVSDSKALIGTLSISDLRTLSGKTEITTLLSEMDQYTVASLIKRIKGDDMEVSVGCGITCCSSDPARDILKLALDSKIHRVWIVESGTYIPKGVITFTDIIRLVFEYYVSAERQHSF